MAGGKGQKMRFCEKTPTDDARPLGPGARWFQTVTGHFATVVCLNLAVILSALPGFLCLMLLLKSRALIFLPLTTLAASVAGPVWAAVNSTVLELQFGFPIYLWRGFLRQFRDNLRQGCVLALIFATLWCLPATVLWIAAAVNAFIPLTVLLCLCLVAFMLSIMSSYAYYQMVTRKLSVWAIFKNSLLLIFSMGWRSATIGSIWIVYIVTVLLFYPVMVPLSIIFGLPVLLCITTQSVIRTKLEALFQERIDY